MIIEERGQIGGVKSQNARVQRGESAKGVEEENGYIVNKDNGAFIPGRRVAGDEGVNQKSNSSMPLGKETRNESREIIERGSKECEGENENSMCVGAGEKAVHLDHVEALGQRRELGGLRVLQEVDQNVRTSQNAQSERKKKGGGGWSWKRRARAVVGIQIEEGISKGQGLGTKRGFSLVDEPETTEVCDLTEKRVKI